MRYAVIRIAFAATAISFAVLASAAPAAAQDSRVTVFAAASLQTALDAVAAAWREETGNTAVVSYAATSALARQIEQGAPADVLISADIAWMDYLSGRGLIDAATRTDLLGNRLVLVAPASSTETVEITASLDLPALLAGGRLALAETTAVPAGRYARAALESLGLWDGVADRLAEVENVRAALALVSRGEAPLGIVYATDDAADPGVRAIGVLPEGSHPPIVYPAAAVAGTGNTDAAAAFFAFLHAPIAWCLFAAEGFSVLPPTLPDGMPDPGFAMPACAGVAP